MVEVRAAGPRGFKVNSVLIAVIAAALLAIPFHVLAEEPTTAARPDVIAPPESPIPADPSIGKWIGEWSGRSGTFGGSMEMEVDVKSDQVTGQVKSTGSRDCSLEWSKLAGVRKGAQVFAQYNLGGRCGKVDVIYSIDPEGKVMTGTWSSEYPGSGAFRLTKSAGFSSAQVPLPADVSIVAPSADMRKDIAAFSGKWVGRWAGNLDAILIVEEITSEKARVLYAWGDAPRWNVSRAYGRYQATVAPGRSSELAFGAGSVNFTVSMNSDMSSVTITRVSTQGVMIETFKRVTS
jgi:hypothetical protein